MRKKSKPFLAILCFFIPILFPFWQSREAHLLDYSGDLYGRRVRVAYLHFLRPERRFDDLDALRGQLERDLADTRRWFAEHPL